MSNETEVKYWRHWITRSMGSELGFVFSKLDADDEIKQLDQERAEYCTGYSSADRPMIWHYPSFSHQISKEDYDARKKYTDPIKQIIYRQCN